MIKKKFIIILCILLFSMSVYAEGDDTIHYKTIDTNAFEDSYSVIKTDGTLYQIPYMKFDKEDLIELTLNEMIPVKIAEDVKSVSAYCVLKEDGTVWEWWERDGEDPGFIMIEEDAKSISSSGAQLIVKNDDTLWGKGSNKWGQLAQGTMDKSLDEQIAEDAKWKNDTMCSPEYFDETIKIMDDVKMALAENAVSVVLKNDGTVWTFGRDSGCATLGIGGKWLVNNEPTKILSEMKEIFLKGGAGFAIDNDDTLWRWGSNYIGYAGGNHGDLLIPEKYIENVKYATNMPGYNLIIKTDNSLWIYGNTDKDNGDIGYTSSDKPIKVADDVAYVAGFQQWYFDNDRILVLKENGDLLLFAIPLSEDKKPYEIGKIMSNVRLPDEEIVNVNFIDISNKSKEEQKAINSLAKAGIINGVSETEFLPDKSMTRAEIAALLLRMTAEEESEGNGGFYDVSSDDWYCGVASKSAELGIVKGFEDNTFRGEDTISKLQFVSLVSRTLEKERGWEYKTNDNLSVPDWAKEDISLAISEGIISENENLDGDITRSEAAVILYKLYDLI